MNFHETVAKAQGNAPTDDAVVKPPRRVVLPPSAFADTWKQKPKTDVCLGLRLISSAEVQGAKGQAEEQARKWYPRKDWADLSPAAIEAALDQATKAFNDGLMRHCVARATCDVNDISKPYFHRAEDTVRDALTEDGIRRLWDELLVLQATSSVAIVRASDDDVERLARVLADGRALVALAPGDIIEIRTLLGYALGILAGTGQAHEKSLEVQSGGYTVRSARR